MSRLFIDYYARLTPALEQRRRSVRTVDCAWIRRPPKLTADSVVHGTSPRIQRRLKAFTTIGCYSIGSTVMVGSLQFLRSCRWIRIVADNTITMPTTCMGETSSPRRRAVSRIAHTGSRQAVTMARVGSRYCNPVKYRENGTSIEVIANTAINVHCPRL